MIRTEALSKYYGTLQAVSDLNLEIATGEVFGFVGPNGAGKTTTIKMLMGFVTPTRGRAWIKGIEVIPGNLPALHRAIGYVPERGGMYEYMTGLEYLSFHGGFWHPKPRHRAEDLLQQFDLPAHRSIRTYSLGMRRRLLIAQGIFHDPELLILDEITSGLDPVARCDILQMIHQLQREGKTIILSSHVLEEIEQVCTTVGIIQNGRLLVKCSLAELVMTGKSLRDTFMAYVRGGIAC